MTILNLADMNPILKNLTDVKSVLLGFDSFCVYYSSYDLSFSLLGVSHSCQPAIGLVDVFKDKVNSLRSQACPSRVLVVLSQTIKVFNLLLKRYFSI